MAKKVVPMIHVPDVRAAVEWYAALGFTVRTHEDDGEMSCDTFYGMRELIIRDLNRFWITFGQAIADR